MLLEIDLYDKPENVIVAMIEDVLAQTYKQGSRSLSAKNLLILQNNTSKESFRLSSRKNFAQNARE